MRRSNRWSSRLRRAATSDEGSAALEFITVGLLLLVPLVYLIVALGQIQGQSLGAEAGARHVARAISTAPDAATATARADAVLRSIVDEYGIDAETVELSLSCRPAGSVCPEAGATVVVTIATRVSLPLVPAVLGLDALASVPVEASAAQKVSRFWGAE
ncbi:MAG TPA: TadE family protein [Microbacterium sp.]|uniref:TadE family protein n=1 Tax=Microbacterium sp. TaxID=51671 RepID=UPI002C0D0657|nr:TadE family protein [Microbacterium sp.]HWI31091.1 TadE family protein [Microbacterium sp.]